MKDLNSGTFKTLLLPSCVALECRGFSVFLETLLSTMRTTCDYTLEKRMQADLHGNSLKITTMSL